MQTLRVTYRVMTTDGEVTEMLDQKVHDRYVRTITSTFRELTNIEGIRFYGRTVAPAFCVSVFFEAIRTHVYLLGGRLLAIDSVVALQPAETA